MIKVIDKAEVGNELQLKIVSIEETVLVSVKAFCLEKETGKEMKCENQSI